MMAISSGGGEGESTRNQVIQLLRDTEAPVVTASEVAEELGISRQAAHAHLSELAEENVVNRRKVGAKAVVWWLAD